MFIIYLKKSLHYTSPAFLTLNNLKYQWKFIKSVPAEKTLFFSFFFESVDQQNKKVQIAKKLFFLYALLYFKD